MKLRRNFFTALFLVFYSCFRCLPLLSSSMPQDSSKAYLFNESSTFTVPDTASRLRVLLVGGGGHGCKGNAIHMAGLAGYVKVVILDNIHSKNATIPVRVGKGGKFPTSHAASKDETYKESSFGNHKIEGGKNCYYAPSYSTNTRCLEHFRIQRVTTGKVVKNISISPCRISTPTVLQSGENGILIGGKGPSAMPGKNNRSSPGGHGYGAGGGSGGEHELPNDVCSVVDGGDGAPGVVYIEVVPRVCRRPVSVIFAIGYATNNSFSNQKKTIQNIIKLMPQRKVGVITFRDKAFLKIDLAEHNDNGNLDSTIADLQNADSTESVNLTCVYAKAVSAFREEEVSRINEYPKVTHLKTLVIFTHSWQDNFNLTRLFTLKRQLKSLGVKIVLVGLDEDQTEAKLQEIVNYDDHVYTSKGDDYHQVLPEKEPYIIDTICREPLVIHNSSWAPTKSMTSSRSRVPPIFTRPSEKNPKELQKEFELLLNYDMQNVDIKNTTEIKRVMNIADELIQQSHRIPNTTETAPGLKVIQFLEDFGLQMASTMDPLSDGDSVSRTFHTNYLGLTVSTVSLMSTTSIGLSDTLMKGHVTLPKDAFEGRGRGTVVMLSSNPVPSMKKENGTDIISQLMSINVNPKSPGVFRKPVQLTFNLNQDLLDGERASCEFWDHKKRGEFPHGFWSSEGCTLASKNDTSVTCHCNHLTSFAVLTRVNPDSKPSSHHMRYLTIITYVGCSLSMLGCLLTIIVHAVLPSLRTERAFIHVNLVVAILLGQGFFFVSALLNGPRVMCFLAAVALYFFYLSVFTWMLVEGLHIYCLVIRVFHSGHERKRLYTAIGWLLPFIITVICASAFRGDFVSTELCWLSVESGAIWAFVGPAIAIIVVNLVILILVLRVTAGVMVKDDIQSRSKSLVRACITLLPILGLTWMFGILAFSNRTVAFEYLFCIFNSLQGLFIFLFYCVGSSEVRRECRRKLHNYETKRSLRTSQNTSGYNNKSKPTNSSKLSRNSEMTGKDKYQSSNYENTLL